MMAEVGRAFMVWLVTSTLAGCAGSGETPSVVDVRYSEHLTVASAEYESAARTNAMMTVKVVQVYAPSADHRNLLRESSRGVLLYESRQPSEIQALFQSLQTTSPTGECDLGHEPKFVVVAYDRDLPRAAVVRLYECDTTDGKVIGVRPVGDAALDYSQAALVHLKRIGVLR